MPAQYRQATIDYVTANNVGNAANRQALVDCSDAAFDATVTAQYPGNTLVAAVSGGTVLPTSEIVQVVTPEGSDVSTSTTTTPEVEPG